MHGTGAKGRSVAQPLSPLKKRGPINLRRKGLDAERSLVRYLQSKGLTATKTSRSGYAGTDLSIDLLGISRSIEVKVRSHGFRQLYEWLGTSDLLIIRADRREPLVVLPMWLASAVAESANALEKETSSGAPRRATTPMFPPPRNQGSQ
jgi:hypothetical protein